MNKIGEISTMYKFLPKFTRIYYLQMENLRYNIGVQRQNR